MNRFLVIASSWLPERNYMIYALKYVEIFAALKKKIPHCAIKFKASTHPEETSKNSDICDFSKVSDIGNEWWTMRNLYFKPFLLVQ